MLLVRMFSWLTIWYWIIGLFFPREDFPSCSDCSLVTYSSLCGAEALQDVFDVPWHASCCPCSAHVQADKLTGLHMSLLKFPGDTVSEQTLVLTFIFSAFPPTMFSGPQIYNLFCRYVRCIGAPNLSILFGWVFLQWQLWQSEAFLLKDKDVF